MPAVLIQLREIWLKLAPPQRWMVGGVAGLTLVALALAVTFGSRVEYRVLATGVSRSEAQKLLTKLDEAGIPYRLAGGGRDIEVAEDRWGDVQALVVQGDLLNQEAGKGYGGLSDLGFGMTEKQQRLKMRIAQEEELAATLRGIEGIERAKVHITPARTSWNQRDERAAKASVTIQARPGRILGTSQVEAVVQVVAHAVESLEPANVAVIDSRGIPLSRAASSDDPSSIVHGRARDQEQYLQAKAESALGMAFGPERAVVRVDLELDMERIEESSTEMDADKKLTKSELILTEENGGGSAPKGTPSTAALQAGSVPGESPRKSNTEKIDATYAYPTKTTHRVKSAGGINRMTVGVLVDETLRDKDAEIARIVKAAVGYSSARDAFEGVAFVPFVVRPEAPPLPEPGMLENPWVVQGFRWGGSLLVGFGLMFVLLRSAKKTRSGIEEVLRVENEEVEEKKAIEVAAQEEADAPAPRREIVEAVERDVESVSRVMKGWMHEPAGR